ncbi:fumble protein, partial [Cystoisospora suis]
KDNLQKGTVWKSAAGEYAASAYDGSTQWTPPRPASEQKLTQRREMVLGAPQPPPFEVLFLRHDGYLGALGALVSADE